MNLRETGRSLTDRARETVAEHGLALMATADLRDEDTARDPSLHGLRSVALLSPDPLRFWPTFSNSAEHRDGAPDPIDRWSRRVGDELALALDARALFPFGGPPWHPFYSWALRSGRIWPSPIALLVNADTGLWTSFRVALGFIEELPLTPGERPCDSCAGTPCMTACPVDAFAAGAYDVDRCRAHCSTPQGADCAALGCRARRACPAGLRSTPPPDQASLHMSAFLRAQGFGE